MNERRNVFVILAFMIGSLIACSSHVAAAEKEYVSLTIDYGDGVQKTFNRIEWKAEMTIGDALDAAQKHARGIKYVKRGSGSATLLTQIDDLKNGENERYWIYRVGDAKGDRSYALVTLKAGDAVLWKFDTYK